MLYRACAAVERPTKWDDDNWVLSSNELEALSVFESQLQSAIDAFSGCDDEGRCPPPPSVRIAFTSGTNFRKTVLPTYKENRKGTRKPMAYSSALQTIQSKYKCLTIEGLEADDIIGIWCTSGDVSDPVIISDDKDFRTIPGKLWRNGELEVTSQQIADWNWMMQTLTGDTSDGYSGLPGVGPKKAEEILHDALDGYGSMSLGRSTLEFMWPAVVQAYVKKGLSAEDALVMARCARILRAEDWNKETKEVVLWSPMKN